MTLKKYWVYQDDFYGKPELTLQSHQAQLSPVYLAADVDRVVEEMRNTILKEGMLANEWMKKHDQLLSKVQADPELFKHVVIQDLQSDLARVTAELENLKACATYACDKKAIIHLCQDCLLEDEQRPKDDANQERGRLP